MTDWDETALRRLVDEADITRVLHLHCRALDRCDEALLLSLYAAGATHAQGPFQGAAAAFVPAALRQMKSIEYASHHLTNKLIEVEGDSARAETYYINFARETDPPSGRVRERIVTGRTLDHLVREATGWKIKSRVVVYDTCHLAETLTGDEQDPKFKHFLPRGARDASDPLYRLWPPGP